MMDYREADAPRRGAQAVRRDTCGGQHAARWLAARLRPPHRHPQREDIDMDGADRSLVGERLGEIGKMGASHLILFGSCRRRACRVLVVRHRRRMRRAPRPASCGVKSTPSGLHRRRWQCFAVVPRIQQLYPRRHAGPLEFLAGSTNFDLFSRRAGLSKAAWGRSSCAHGLRHRRHPARPSNHGRVAVVRRKLKIEREHLSTLVRRKNRW